MLFTHKIQMLGLCIWAGILCPFHKCFVSLGMEVEAMKQENARLQHIFDNQQYSAADIERINHDRNELQQTVNNLTKELEAEEHQLWNEELKYARNKEAVCENPTTLADGCQFSSSKLKIGVLIISFLNNLTPPHMVSNQAKLTTMASVYHISEKCFTFVFPFFLFCT